MTSTDVILGLLLVAHLLSLRLLTMCHREVSNASPAFTSHLSALGMGLEEVIRVGSDLCDGVESISNGQPVQEPVSFPGEQSVGNTILSLLLSKMMAPEHGEKERTRTIFKDNTATPESDAQE